ncbi:MAG TPA: hypothetical protein VFT48_00160 [Pyrinomonadaceae bacterium]|nr:hypothetical protein [Pyrinomonadaceae bacterium]
MKRTIQVATMFLVFGFGYAVSHACFCIPLDVQESYDNAKAVFVGQVLDVIPPRSTDPNAEFVDAAHTIKFRVDKSWKGLFLTEASVLTRLDSCFGLHPAPRTGDRYLVYARAVDQKDPSRTELVTGSCTRTALLSENSPASGVYRNQAADDIRALNSITIIFGPRPRPTTIFPNMNFLEPDN